MQYCSPKCPLQNGNIGGYASRTCHFQPEQAPLQEGLLQPPCLWVWPGVPSTCFVESTPHKASSGRARCGLWCLTPGRPKSSVGLSNNICDLRLCLLPRTRAAVSGDLGPSCINLQSRKHSTNVPTSQAEHTVWTQLEAHCRLRVGIPEIQVSCLGLCSPEKDQRERETQV